MKCDMDCFNCKFDDCISDSTVNPIKVSVSQVDKKEKLRLHKAEYYQKTREHQIEKSKKYYYEHREEILKKKKERLNAHRSK